MTSKGRITKGMWWDRAWTLTKGCTPVTAGCANCWSAAQSHIRSKQAKPPPCYVGVTEHGKWNGVVEPIPTNLDKPLRVRKPTTWAVWNDLFHEAISDEFIAAAFGVMAACPRHLFLVLTKRPERMRAWFEWASDCGFEWASDCGFEAQRAMFEMDTHEWCVRHVMRAAACRAGIACPLYHPEDRVIDVKWPLPNVWLGASASNQEDLERVVPDLYETPAAVRFLSLEPLLGPIDLEHIPSPGRMGVNIDWIVVGAESGPGHRDCDHNWIASITEQCEAAGVPCFVKQEWIDGKLVKMPMVRGRVWDQMPA